MSNELDALPSKMPYKRWHIWLSGHWENGWRIEAHSRVAGGFDVLDIELPTKQGWGQSAIGYKTAAEAIAALSALLAPVPTDPEA